MNTKEETTMQLWRDWKLFLSALTARGCVAGVSELVDADADAAVSRRTERTMRFPHTARVPLSRARPDLNPNRSEIILHEFFPKINFSSWPINPRSGSEPFSFEIVVKLSAHAD